MAIKGNARRYGSVAIALHWIAAPAVLTALALGFVAANAASEERQAAILRLHVPIGLAILVLMVARILWRWFDVRPRDPAGQPRWQSVVAHTNHALLYAISIVMGVSGLGLLILSGAASVLFLGAAGPLPRFMDFPPMKVHAIAAFALVALIVIHVLASFYHQLVRRDHLLTRIGVGSRNGLDEGVAYAEPAALTMKS